MEDLITKISVGDRIHLIDTNFMPIILCKCEE